MTASGAFPAVQGVPVFQRFPRRLLNSHRDVNVRWVRTEFLVKNLLDQIVSLPDVLRWRVTDDHELLFVHEHAVFAVIYRVEEGEAVGLGKVVVVVHRMLDGFVQNFVPAVLLRVLRNNLDPVPQILKRKVHDRHFLGIHYHPYLIRIKKSFYVRKRHLHALPVVKHVLRVFEVDGKAVNQ